MAHRYEHQERFVRLVTDSQPNTVFIADEEGRYWFANRTAASDAGISAADMLGKTVASVLGPDAAWRYEQVNREALATEHSLSRVHRFNGEDSIRVLRSEHIPLAATDEIPRGVLVVEQDITDAVTERERRERTLDRVVKTLVSVVDRRDPNAAHHSVRVGAVARMIAEEMDLDPVTVETVEIAGNVMNLGKILVPPELLTKTENLNAAEIERVRDSINTSAELLEGIEFDGPVVETLRQVQKRWDGAGRPQGRAGTEIIVTARIVAVANAFVALVSPRAHRPGVDLDEAMETLLTQVGKGYDRRVVATLVNHLDNHGGRTRWSEVATTPA